MELNPVALLVAVEQLAHVLQTAVAVAGLIGVAGAAVFVGAVGHAGVHVVLVDEGHAAGHGAVAHVPAQGEAEEVEDLARLDLVQIAAQVLNAHDAVAQHLLVAGLPGAPYAQILQLAELLVVGGLAVDADVLELVELA